MPIKNKQTKPTSQLDLEARAEKGFQTVTSSEVDPNEVNDQYAVKDNDTSGYVGVSPEYMTYANDTEKPLSGDGVEDEVAEGLLGGFALAKPAPAAEDNQTVGGGASSPVVYAATSGSDVQTEVVDPKTITDAVDDEEDREKQPQAATAAAPAPVTPAPGTPSS